MRRLGLILFAAAGVLAQPAAAALKSYTLSGDQSSLFPTCGTILHPGAVSGTALIDETGDGTPVLVDLEVQVDWAELIGYVDIGGIPGTSVTLESHQVLRPAPSQSGVGDTTSTIHWGSLTGWTQTGYYACITHIPGGSPPPSACVTFVGFEGTGPPTPLASDSFDTDPWSFGPDGFSLTAPPVQIVNLGMGLLTGTVQWKGDLNVGVPALPLLGLAALSAALLYLGVRSLRR
jgi:hypothetical protein